MRVLVCGDRNWTDSKLICDTLVEVLAKHLPEPGAITIIQGEARGADSIGRDVALSMGWQVLGYPAQWDKFGKAAGPIRNQQMLDQGRPDLVVAFHDDLSHSKGTRHMVKIAQRAGVAVRVVSHGN